MSVDRRGDLVREELCQGVNRLRKASTAGSNSRSSVSLQQVQHGSRGR